MAIGSSTVEVFHMLLELQPEKVFAPHRLDSAQGQK